MTKYNRKIDFRDSDLKNLSLRNIALKISYFSVSRLLPEIILTREG